VTAGGELIIHLEGDAIQAGSLYLAMQLVTMIEKAKIT